MERQLRGLGQKGFNWAKKKAQNIPSEKSGTAITSPQSAPTGSGYAGHGHSVQQDGRAPAHVCFPAYPATSSLQTDTSTTRRRELVVSHVAFLGDVHSKTTYVVRDLGFQGQIGPYILLTYGDTIFTDRNYKNDTFRGMTSDSMALATHDPLQVVDPALDENGYPQQFCPLHKAYDEDPSECALGITNVIETKSGEGIVFFLLNHRPGGINNLRGAGVATVSLSNTYPPVPNVTRLSRYWWDGDTEPWYGDICALRHNNYIYAYGHAKDDPFVYLARVHWESATRLDCYEYWNGEGWQKQRPKTKELGEKASMFWQVNQGQVFWSAYFGCFLFVYCDNWMNSKVLAKTAPAPEGPWSEPITLYQATPITEGSSIYAAVPHPYYEHSGRTLVVTFTNHPNTIQAIKITFGDGGPV